MTHSYRILVIIFSVEIITLVTLQMQQLYLKRNRCFPYGFLIEGSLLHKALASRVSSSCTAPYTMPCIFLGTPLESTEKQVSKAEHLIPSYPCEG